jgi:NADH-quinone oxidoreductase subunit H
VVSAILMTSLATGTGTLSMLDIVRSQEQQQIWFIFKFFPLGLIAFFLFAIAMIAETNRAPFDLPEAESELVAGFHTEYSGFRWSLFFLAEYAAMVAVSSVAVTLWLGGWLRPFPNTLTGETWDTAFSVVPGFFFLFLAGWALFTAMRMPKLVYFRIQRLGLAAFGLLLGLIGLVLFVEPVRSAIGPVFWFIAKVGVFMYLYIWYRGTFPRYRFDQLMKLGWKFMIPLGIGVLILTAIVGVWPELMKAVRG